MATNNTSLRGDVNGDNAITKIDVRVLIQKVINVNEEPDENGMYRRNVIFGFSSLGEIKYTINDFSWKIIINK